MPIIQRKEGEKKDALATEDSLRPPTISLPKGGGAIKGIDDKFTVNPASGTASLSIPIYSTPGRSDFHPKLSLNYDSGAGNGPFGLGWALSMPSITRKTDKGLPRFLDAQESDTYIISGAEDLVPVRVQDEQGYWRPEVYDRIEKAVDYTVFRYRPRIEGLFARIERWQNNASGEIHWRSTSKDNVTTIYGKSPETRISDPQDSTRVFSWLIEYSYDDRGNVIFYTYKKENGDNVDLSLPHQKNRLRNKTSYAQRYLKHIKYANKTPYRSTAGDLPDDWMMEVVFDYGEHDPYHPLITETQTWSLRADAFSSYRAGFEIRTQRLCRRVLMFHHFPELGDTPCLVRSTDLDYRQSPTLTFLKSVTQTGYKRKAPTGDYLRRSFPPLEFNYSEAVICDQIFNLDQDSLANLPHGLDGGQYQWLDLDGEGVSGILSEQADGWFYKHNLGDAQFGPLQTLLTKPSLGHLQAGQVQFMDLAADGQKDLVLLDPPLAGFFERRKAQGWHIFVPFRSKPAIDWRDPNLRLLDLTGDGHTDVMITEDEVFTWYPSEAESGFGPPETVFKSLDEEQGPALVFSDALQSIYLADMSGDGLSDIVRIKNGEICYWPNLGYGRFGAKVTMDCAPYFDHQDAFNQNRIRLADIDGSGTTDIIYLGPERIHIWFNQAGNSWSLPHQLSHFPPTDNLSSVQVLDLLGTGTACIVWSSPLPNHAPDPMRYINLMAAGKPHLLKAVNNNMGAETRLQYASSTKFYLHDLKAGRPWITKLPFPVHVAERVETLDHISKTKLVTVYRYHHGYFDGQDREFRGFGMVEQWDTEYFDRYNEPGLFESGFETVPAGFYTPPVLSKMWFHTGFYKDQEQISTLYQKEYYRQDPEAELLPDTVLPESLSVQETHEACRALKGRLLRREIYALDQSAKSDHPYQVTESNYRLVKLQPYVQGRHAVFLAHESETLHYQYERSPHDPRMSHNLVLEVDQNYGYIKKAAAIAYPRRPPEDGGAHKPEQMQPLATYTESAYIDLDDDLHFYRVGLPCEVKIYQITGLQARGIQPFSIDEIKAVKDFEEIQYHHQPTDGLQQKRLIKHSRTLYYADDQSSPLVLRMADTLALPYKTYQLALAPGIIDDVFGQDSPAPDNPAIQIDDALLRDEAGYVKEDDLVARGLFPAGNGQGNWWIPSGHQEFDQDRFYLPLKFIDPLIEPLGLAYTTVYDHTCLLVEKVIDPLANEVSAANDYRTMQPYRVTDPNGNRSQVAFDALGMVVGTAVMGKEHQTAGDSLEDFMADLDDQTIIDQINDPFADPHAIIQNATTRLVYDFGRFHRSQADSPAGTTGAQPVVVYTLTRETHTADLAKGKRTKVRHSFLYADGLGREVQTKIQAEPGDVKGERTERRWVGSGWTIYNNKGKPVKQYEPFFCSTHEFQDKAINGQGAVLFYDPIERLVATLRPDHTYEKVVFGPWRQENWDVNDTLSQGPPNADPDVGFYFDLLDVNEYLPTWYDKMMSGTLPEQQTAANALKHAGTPDIARLDVLGRAFLTVEYNTLLDDQRKVTDIVAYQTHLALDIEGMPLRITNARGNNVMSYHYDMSGQQLFEDSMDAGARWVLANAAGLPIRAWDRRGHRVRTRYDTLQRPTHIYVQAPVNPQNEFLAEYTVYGEDHPHAREHNLIGQVYRQHDAAGIATNRAFDFKGNLLASSRQLIKTIEESIDWSQNPEPENEIFVNAFTYDALNRPIRIITPHPENGTGSILPNIIQPVYNEASLLQEVNVWLRPNKVPEGLLDPRTADLPAVTNIDYNAKGQRVLIEYGNNTRTEYTYDDQTFRLLNLKTYPDSPGGYLQDLSYIYDPLGNIAEIHDDAQQTVYYRNAEVSPHRQYEYDALYRLIMATGREHIGQHTDRQHDHNDFNPLARPHPNDTRAMRAYTQHYIYDEVGNILRMIHKAGHAPGGQTIWKRRYQYASESNRLMSTCLPEDVDGPNYSDSPSYSMRYAYDSHGNMIQMPHLASMAWDFRDQLQSVQTQVVNDGPTPQKTWYVYDAAGQRVRKLRVKNNGAIRQERIYLGGVEIYRRWDGDNLTKEIQTLHIMDDRKRITLVETALHDSGRQKEDPQPVCRYQIDNHLGSCSLELDQNGRVISYEEYYPYGSTSYQAVKPEIDISLKRYRFSGKEMNAESGLYYYGARYYAAWLGRWIKPDPAKLVDGLNLYSYVSNNPVKFVDPNGNQELLAQGVPDVSPEDYDQWHYESIRQSLWDIGLFKVIAASGTAGEDYLIRAIMKYENALFCLESDLCEDKWEAFQQLKESSNQRLFASLAIACERPLLAAEAVLSIPDQIMRMMGMSEQDIQAVNFALMMTGIGEARSLASSSRKLMSRRSVSKVYPTRKSPKTGKLQELRPSKGGEGPRRWHNVRQEKVSTTAGEYGRYIQQGLKIEEAQYLLNPYTGMGHHFFARRLRLPAFFSESRFNVLKPNITIGQFYELHYKIDLSFHGAAFPRSIGGSWSGSGLGIQRYGLMLRLWHGSPRPLKLTVGGTFVGGSAGALYYALSDDED